jgi:hypothetical protein
MTDLEKAEYEDVLRKLVAKCEALAAENAKLRSEKSDALSVLKEIYSDPDASQAHRIKAAGLALPHEKPRLQPVPPAIDATAEEIIPLSELVEQQRKRCDELLALPMSVRAAMIPGSGGGSRNGGNGSDDDTGS